MRPDHLLGPDGHCLRCRARLGPPPLPQAPLVRQPEVLRHEIQVAPEILAPTPAPAPPAPEPEGRPLTDAELGALRKELRKSVKMFLDSKEEDDDFKAGVVFWTGMAFVGFNPTWIADFAQLPEPLVLEQVARLRAAGIVVDGERPTLSPVVRQRFDEDAAKAKGKRGRGGHKGSPLPFCVRFILYTLVAQGQAEYELAGDRFSAAPAGIARLDS